MARGRCKAATPYREPVTIGWDRHYDRYESLLIGGYESKARIYPLGISPGL